MRRSILLNNVWGVYTGITTHLLEEWSPGDESSDSFAKDPPNATVSVLSKDGSVIRDAVVVLRTPKLDGDRLTFDVQVLEGSLAGADGPPRRCLSTGLEVTSAEAAISVASTGAVSTGAALLVRRAAPPIAAPGIEVQPSAPVPPSARLHWPHPTTIPTSAGITPTHLAIKRDGERAPQVPKRHSGKRPRFASAAKATERVRPGQ